MVISLLVLIAMSMFKYPYLCIVLKTNRSVLLGLKTRGEAESSTTASFLVGFKISDIDQLILALIFRSGVILV